MLFPIMKKKKMVLQIIYSKHQTQTSNHQHYLESEVTCDGGKNILNFLHLCAFLPAMGMWARCVSSASSQTQRWHAATECAMLASSLSPPSPLPPSRESHPQHHGILVWSWKLPNKILYSYPEGLMGGVITHTNDVYSSNLHNGHRYSE